MPCRPQVDIVEIGDPAALAVTVGKMLPMAPDVEWILQRNDDTMPLWYVQAFAQKCHPHPYTRAARRIM